MEAVASLNAAIELLEQAELSLQARKSTTIPTKYGMKKTDVVEGLLKEVNDATQKLKQIEASQQEKLHAVPKSEVKNLISLAETLRYVANNDSLLSSKMSTRHVTAVELHSQLKSAVRSLEVLQEGASGNTVIDTAVASKSGKSPPINPVSLVAYPTTSDNESITADKEKDSGAPSDASELLLQKRGRIMRACDECRRKEIKCDGKQPCTHCQVLSYECTYYKPSNHRRSPDPQYIESLEKRMQRAEVLLKMFMPDLDLEDPTLDSAVAESSGKLIPGDNSDEDTHKYTLNHSKDLEETTRADINRLKFAGYLSEVRDWYIGTPSHARYDVSEFQQGPAMDYPEIPGEPNRNEQLSHIRARWPAASVREVPSRNGSPDSYVSGKNESGLHGNDTPSRKRYDLSGLQQGPAMDYPEIPGEPNRNKHLSHLRERWPAPSIREVSSRNGSPDSHIADNESFKSPRHLDLQDVEILENRLQRAELLLNEIMPDGALKDPISDPLAALPSTELMSGSDNAHHIRFIDSQQGYFHSERGNLDDISESASTDTSCYSRGSMYDMASTASTELVVDASNESEILALFVSLVHRSDAVVKALDHIVTSTQTYYTAANILARVRASLKSFVALLKLETPQEHETVPSIFLGRSWQISLLIMEAAISRRDAGSEPPDGDDSDVSDDESLAEEDYYPLNQDQMTSERAVPDVYINTSLFERIILESNAFTEFLASLYNIAFPDFTTRLERIVRWLDTKGLETQKSQVRELFSELAYAQPTQIMATTHRPSVSDKVKNVVESVTGTWNWWPLAAPMKPLDPGEMRISWTCRCGRTRNENVPEKLAKALISLAKSTPPAISIPLRLSSAVNLGRQPSSISPSGSTVQEASSSTNQAPSQDVSIVRLPSPGSLMAAYPNQQTRTIFFMTQKGAMHPRSMGLGQSRISTQGKCNDRFFKDVRSGYWTYRGCMRTMFSIYQFGFCEFYRFTEYAVNKYARGPQEEIPDLEKYKNEYYYRKTVWTPQVSHEEFRDRFWNCLSDCNCNDNGTVDLIPQRIDQTEPAADKVFYGIIAREEKQIYMAVIYLAIIGVSIIPSLWFFFNWLSADGIADEALLSNRKGNLSNAIVPLSLCLTLLSCTLGVLIAI